MMTEFSFHTKPSVNYKFLMNGPRWYATLSNDFFVNGTQEVGKKLLSTPSFLPVK